MLLIQLTTNLRDIKQQGDVMHFLKSRIYYALHSHESMLNWDGDIIYMEIVPESLEREATISMIELTPGLVSISFKLLSPDL